MISIIHPSRSRPQKALARRDEWVGSAATKVEYILSIDEDDPAKEKYFTLFSGKADTIIVNRNRSLVDATNRGAEVATGDIFVVVSDDFFCFPNWDLAILKAAEGKKDFVLKTYDGLQKWICTLPILDRAYYERLGYIYHPKFLHLFCDTHQTHLADMDGKLIIRNDIVFKHEHHYENRKNRDLVAIRSDNTQPQGERAYREIVRQWMADGRPVYDLSNEAREHVLWLRKRMGR